MADALKKPLTFTNSSSTQSDPLFYIKMTISNHKEEFSGKSAQEAVKVATTGSIIGYVNAVLIGYRASEEYGMPGDDTTFKHVQNTWVKIKELLPDIKARRSASDKIDIHDLMMAAMGRLLKEYRPKQNEGAEKENANLAPTKAAFKPGSCS